MPSLLCIVEVCSVVAQEDDVTKSLTVWDTKCVHFIKVQRSEILRGIWERAVVYFKVLSKSILEIHYCPKQHSRNGGFHPFLSQLISGVGCYKISLSLDSFPRPRSSPWSHFCSLVSPPWAPVFCSGPRPCAWHFHVLVPACPARFQCGVFPVFSRSC